MDTTKIMEDRAADVKDSEMKRNTPSSKIGSETPVHDEYDGGG